MKWICLRSRFDSSLRIFHCRNDCLTCSHGSVREQELRVYRPEIASRAHTYSVGAEHKKSARALCLIGYHYGKFSTTSLDLAD